MADSILIQKNPIAEVLHDVDQAVRISTARVSSTARAAAALLPAGREYEDVRVLLGAIDVETRRLCESVNGQAEDVGCNYIKVAGQEFLAS